jgi:hypothetical protein
MVKIPMERHISILEKIFISNLGYMLSICQHPITY